MISGFTTDWSYMERCADLIEKIKKETDNERKKKLEKELEELELKHRMICT